MRIDTEKKTISTGWSEEANNQVFRFFEGLTIEEMSQYSLRLNDEVGRVLQTFDEIYKRKQGNNIPPTCSDMQSCSRY